ncbi:MAG: hypothetical protein R3F60_06200 [bacterium]
MVSLLVGCDQNIEDCTKDPTLAICNADSGCAISGPLKYMTVLNSHNSTVYRGQCGSYERAVAFQLPGGAPGPGWVVQRVVVEYENWNPNPSLAMCVEGETGSVEFFELIGPVPTGGKAPFSYDCLAGPVVFDGNGEPIPYRRPADNSIIYAIDFNGQRGARTDDGHFYLSTEARFYTVEDMDGFDPLGEDGAEYWLTASVPFSGTACSHRLAGTEGPPPFWGSQTSVDREIDLSWDCCPDVSDTVANFDTNCR